MTRIYITEERKRMRGRGSGDGIDGCEGGDADGDSEASEADGSADDERPRKRGRPPVAHREKIRGFTDQEVALLTK